MQRVWFDTPTLKVAVEGQMIELTLSGAPLLHLSMNFKITLHICFPYQVLVSCEKIDSKRPRSTSLLKVNV